MLVGGGGEARVDAAGPPPGGGGGGLSTDSKRGRLPPRLASYCALRAGFSSVSRACSSWAKTRLHSSGLAAANWRTWASRCSAADEIS